MTWEFETSGLDGQCELFGVNIFQYRWRDCRETAAVIDPHYGTEKVFHVYLAKKFLTFFAFSEILGKNLIYLYTVRFVHCSQWRFYSPLAIFMQMKFQHYMHNNSFLHGFHL